MHGSLNVILAILIGLSMILVAQYNILAQSPDAENSEGALTTDEPPRAMIDRLQQEIEDMQAKIAENPSAPEAKKLREKIQENEQRVKWILSRMTGQPESEIINIEKRLAESRRMAKGADAQGLERYMVIVQKNLFTPLGSGGEPKQQKFAVTGILSSGAKKMALIQLIGERKSFYVAEGGSFGNGARLARIGENRVTIIHEGNSIELKLGEGVPTGQPQREKVGESGQRGKPSGKEELKQAKDLRREEESRMRENEKREQIKQKIEVLNREREELKRKIMEMERNGHVDQDVYRRIEKIDYNIRDLESSLR